MAEIEWVILADNAEVIGNRLFLMGGGWDTLAPPNMPFTQFLAIAVSLQVDWEDVAHEVEHRIDIAHAPVGGDQKLLARAVFTPVRTPLMREGENQRAQLAIKLSIQFDMAGTHDIITTLDGQTSKSVRFYVNPASGSPPAGAQPVQPKRRARRKSQS
jgi:hypothetical protein